MSVLVISDTWPIARKEHRCVLCHRIIRVEEKYHRQWNIWDDGPYTWKGCAHCSAMARICDLWAWADEGLSEDAYVDYEPNTIARGPVADRLAPQVDPPRWLALPRPGTNTEERMMHPVSHNLLPVWMDDALCTQFHGCSWFPEVGESGRAAKAVCAQCPVRLQCLRLAVDSPVVLEGIWGGLSERQRRKLRKKAA